MSMGSAIQRWELYKSPALKARSNKGHRIRWPFPLAPAARHGGIQICHHTWIGFCNPPKPFVSADTGDALGPSVQGEARCAETGKRTSRRFCQRANQPVRPGRSLPVNPSNVTTSPTALPARCDNYGQCPRTAAVQGSPKSYRFLARHPIVFPRTRGGCKQSNFIKMKFDCLHVSLAAIDSRCSVGAMNIGSSKKDLDVTGHGFDRRNLRVMKFEGCVCQLRFRGCGHAAFSIKRGGAVG